MINSTEKQDLRGMYYQTNDPYWGVVEMLSYEYCDEAIPKYSRFFYEDRMYTGKSITYPFKTRVFYEVYGDIDTSQFVTKEDHPEYLL